MEKEKSRSRQELLGKGVKEKPKKRDLEKEWSLMLKQIENSVSKLLENRFFFQEFMNIVEGNPALPANNFFIVWVWENYLLNAALGVRRMVDKDERTVSLYLLLKDIKENPEILSRERFAALFNDTGFADDSHYINMHFDRLVGRGKGYIDPADVEDEIQLLLKKTDRLKKYVNETVAHLDKKKVKELPKIKDLNDSIDLLENLVHKYYAIFHAGGINLLPVPQLPWKDIFKIPWIPREKKVSNERSKGPAI